MRVPSQKTKSVRIHDFAMNPAADVPRSQFNLSHRRMVPFGFANVIPILCEFALPGDTWNCRIACQARTAVPITQIQDAWHLEFFSFFIPMRLVWDNSNKFWGEQANPGDSINFTIPTLTAPAGGFPVSSIFDYFGLPTIGQCNAAIPGINALPFRAHNLIYNEWFKDENLQSALTVLKTDGPDPSTNYNIYRRGKRFDYFTQALPWPQKGNTAISIPLGTSAPVKTSGAAQVTGAQPALKWTDITGAGTNAGPLVNNPGTGTQVGTLATGAVQNTLYPNNLFADLTLATASTINALRTSITLQQYLEKDARGGTRYNEFVWNMFKVRTQDSRLNRPEFIGGGYAPIITTPIPQTSGTGLTGGTTPIGTLGASGFVDGARAGFTYSATEHGYIITYVSARADLTYSQGLRRMWTASTRYDFPVPLLANLGEQTLLNKEIFCDASANDNNVFGYVPRWDEYRFIPSQICGIYKPTAAGNIAYWHSSQQFSGLPVLGATFITDDSGTVLQRNFAAGAATANQQILGDFYFDVKTARALPLYGIPGLTRL